MMKGMLLTPDDVAALIDEAFTAGVQAVEQATCSEGTIEAFKQGQERANKAGKDFPPVEQLVREAETRRTAEIQVETRIRLFNRLMGGWAAV